MTRAQIKDPMLHAAAEVLVGEHPDHMRWLRYADEELARLRGLCGLPTPTGYSLGKPDYPPVSAYSAQAQEIRRAVEERMNGRFSLFDRAAVESVLDEILADSTIERSTDD